MLHASAMYVWAPSSTTWLQTPYKEIQKGTGFFYTCYKYTGNFISNIFQDFQKKSILATSSLAALRTFHKVLNNWGHFSNLQVQVFDKARRKPHLHVCTWQALRCTRAKEDHVSGTQRPGF